MSTVEKTVEFTRYIFVLITIFVLTDELIHLPVVDPISAFYQQPPSHIHILIISRFILIK